MRTAVSLLSSLLFIWISGSSYIYVCKIRKDCQVTESIVEESVAVEVPETEIQQVAPVEQALPVPAPYTIYFDFNKSQSEITSESLTHFELIKRYLDAESGKKVVVTGHSDNMGPDIAKEQVSRMRADFVAEKLTESGILATTIELKSESDNKPAGDNSTREGRAKNRRVEIIIQ